MKSSPIIVESQSKPRPFTTPERPKPTSRQSNTAIDARKSQPTTTTRTFKAPSSHSEPPKEHHSRKSIHSHSESRHSGAQPKKQRDRSRTQSTAYPYFDMSTLDARPSSIDTAITTAADAVARSSTKPSMTRDLSGNLTFYDVDEEPEITELGSSSIGFCTSNGRVNSIARRQSRLASLHESSRPQIPTKSWKRNTTVPFPSSSPTAVRPAGLGLFPVDARAELCAAAAGEETGERERTPVSVLQVKNGGMLEVQKGRQTWGSWKSVLGRSGRWVSGGYWSAQEEDDKVFI